MVERLEIGLTWPDGWRDRILAAEGYLAGSDEQRADQLVDALALGGHDLWMARGGYGCIRTLDVDRLRTRNLFIGPPGTLWGFSDGTVLLAAWDRAGWPAWHAPPISQLPRLDDASLARVHRAWHEGTVAAFSALRGLAPGTASGPLAGGNLCVLASCVGTPWAADLRGRIVLLEDTGEAPYKVDRLMTQLVTSGALEGCAGVILGAFTDVTEEQRSAIDAFFQNLAPTLGVPVAAGLPVGHGAAHAPLPYGSGSRLHAHLQVDPDGGAILDFRDAT